MSQLKYWVSSGRNGSDPVGDGDPLRWCKSHLERSFAMERVLVETVTIPGAISIERRRARAAPSSAITMFIDVYSTAVVGALATIGQPQAGCLLSFLRCLAHGKIVERPAGVAIGGDWGLPATLCFDNSHQYLGIDLAQFCQEACIDVIYHRSCLPSWKGRVESLAASLLRKFEWGGCPPPRMSESIHVASSNDEAREILISAAWQILDGRNKRVARPGELTPLSRLIESQAKTGRRMPSGSAVDA